MRWSSVVPLLFLAIGSLQFQTVSPAVSKDADYKAVFNENLPWPDSESALQYSSARKFALVGERQQAAANLASVSRKLERRLQASQLAFGTWAQLQAAILAREAELLFCEPLKAPAQQQAAAQYEHAISSYSAALHVCLNASAVIECGQRWGGLGLGSCCVIAAAFSRALEGLCHCDAPADLSSPAQASFTCTAAVSGGHVARFNKEAARMQTLARRLTPQPARPRPNLPSAQSERSRLPTPFSQRSSSDTEAGATINAPGAQGKERMRRIVLLTTATGAYNSFVDPLIESARRYFFAGSQYEVSYVVFTDAPPAVSAQTDVSYVYRKDLGWPLTAMLRYRTFLECWHMFAHGDYLFSIDVDCLFVAPVGPEILADSVATAHADNAYYDGSEVTGPVTVLGNTTCTTNGRPLHPQQTWSSPEFKGYMWHQSDLTHLAPGDAHTHLRPAPAVYELRPESRACINPEHDEPERYYYSGFFGGGRRRVFHMLSAIAAASEEDMARGIVARVHDESHVNRYWASFRPARVLTAAYMYPEGAVFRRSGMCPRRQWSDCGAPDAAGHATNTDMAQVDAWCTRDEMHPWLWTPFGPLSAPHVQPRERGQGHVTASEASAEECRRTPVFVPRILNVAKVKQRLIEDGAARGGREREERGGGRAGERVGARGGNVDSGGDSGTASAGGGGGGDEVTRWMVWSSDMHIGPIADLKQIWRGAGIETHDQSLSAHCHLTRTCATTLRVLDASNAMTLGDDVANDDSYRHDSPPLSAMNPAALPAARGARGVYSPVRVRFYEAYRGDALMRQMDAVVCSHPVASCELYLPLGLPLVLFVTTRFDLGRLYSADALNRWIQTVRAVSGEAGPGGGGGGEGPPGVVIANNLYDAGYVEYFTGVRPVVLPSLCRDTGGALWMWPLARREVLLDVCDDVRCPPFRQKAMRKLVASLQQLRAQKALQGASSWELAELRRVYPHYTLADLAQHPAIVLFPYQVSVMAVFQWRAMGIPMFAPSLDLLTTWHMRYGLVFERRVDWQSAGTRQGSLVGAHPNARAELRGLDPNDERDPVAVRFWLGKADIYTCPHVVLFDSLEHLLHLLETTDLPALSAKLRAEHAALEARVHAGWRRVFLQLLANRPPGSRAHGRVRATGADTERAGAGSDGAWEFGVQDLAGGDAGGDANYSAALARFFPQLAALYPHT